MISPQASENLHIRMPRLLVDWRQEQTREWENTRTNWSRHCATRSKAQDKWKAESKQAIGVAQWHEKQCCFALPTRTAMLQLWTRVVERTDIVVRLRGTLLGIKVNYNILYCMDE